MQREAAVIDIGNRKAVSLRWQITSRAGKSAFPEIIRNRAGWNAMNRGIEF
jgi:hypothetical protein